LKGGRLDERKVRGASRKQVLEGLDTNGDEVESTVSEIQRDPTVEARGDGGELVRRHEAVRSQLGDVSRDNAVRGAAGENAVDITAGFVAARSAEIENGSSHKKMERECGTACARTTGGDTSA
jgi:hypothetical protein